MTYIVFVFIYLKFLLVNASVDVATSDVDQLPPDPRQQQRGLERYDITLHCEAIWGSIKT